MDAPVSIPYTIDIDVANTAVLAKIKSTLKCFKDVVRISTPYPRRQRMSKASKKTLDAIMAVERGECNQYDSFEDFVAAMNHEIQN